MGEHSFSIQTLASLLSPTLGEERSRELLRGVLGSINVSSDVFSFADAVRALEVLGRAPGVVGSAARFANVRLTLSSAADGTDRSPSTPPSARQGLSPSKNKTVTSADLSALLAPTVGQERSEEVVRDAIRQM